MKTGKATKIRSEVQWFLWENNPEELGTWVDSLGFDPLDFFDAEGKHLQLYVGDSSISVLPKDYVIHLSGGSFSRLSGEEFHEIYNVTP